MIPIREQLEPWYEAGVLDELDAIRTHLSQISDPVANLAIGREAIANIWPDQDERIQNTHWIQVKPSRDKNIEATPGTKLLRWHYVQQKFYDDVWVPAKLNHRPCRALVLKARQLGMSTQMQSLYYDEADQQPNLKIQTISYDKESAVELFDKSRFIHDNLWFPRKLSRDRGGQIVFNKPHHSAFYTTTARNPHAGRGWFFAHLHLSEVPMWEHADETANSVLQCVADAPGTSVVMEFTARGAQGYAYETWCDAVDGKNDYVPFFAPWFWDPGYTTPFETDLQRSEFLQKMSRADEEFQSRYKLTLEQMNWWDWVLRNKCGGSELKRKQEYPSNAEEAFLMSGSPVFERTDLLQKLEDNCCEPMRKGHILLTENVA